MKQEILKKTLLYRLLAFGIGTLITTLLLWKEPLLSFTITVVSESASIILYYAYEYLWRRRESRRNFKKGMNIFVSEGDKHNWYNVVEVLDDNKFIIEVV